MRTADLDFPFPEELIAIEPARPTRVMWVPADGAGSGPHDGPRPLELTVPELLEKIPAGDVLVLNDTKVLHRRVFGSVEGAAAAADAGASAPADLEILFLSSDDDRRKWQVLFPSRALKIGDRVRLPEGRAFTLVKKGRPQEVETDTALDEDYFRRVGELPLPPYIQKARAERHMRGQDEAWYQTAWAEKPGSFAAPTASLHLTGEDLRTLEKRGVHVARVTLHVGLGTFLPVTADDLDRHEMHSELAELPAATWRQVQSARLEGRHVWALGTTVARTLESAGSGKLGSDGLGGFRGSTDLLIQPGYRWAVVDRLLTNFHQPKSTLLALVASFAGLEKAKACYHWAVERRFRLFSYGDLSVWIR